MPHEGYADPVTNNGPGFHSDIPVRKLTEHVTRDIEASDVSSTPLVAETVDGVMHKTRPTPWPCLALGSMLHRARPPRSHLMFGLVTQRLRLRSWKRWLRT